MKLVSKYWQEIKDNKELIEKYDYLSLRDREAYSILKKYYNEIGGPGLEGFNASDNSS